MRTLQAAIIYKYPKLIFLCDTLFCAAIANMAVHSESVMGSQYLMSLFGAILICCAIPIGAMTNCIFMTIPFTSVLKLPIEAFSFITLLQLVFIIKSMFIRPDISIAKIIIISLVAVASQFFPIIVANQTLNNIILLTFNLITFYCALTLTKNNRISITQAYFSFSVGVLVAGIVSQVYGIHVAEMQDYRFCGLWTDPNFWGMFCLIGIVTCLLLGFEKPYMFLITLPIIVLLAAQGFLTLSRTFIVVCSLMVLVISWRYLKRSFLGSIIVVGILCVGIYYALPYATEIFSERALNDDDISNGRFNNTSLIFDYMFKHWDFTVFGFGYNNVLNAMEINNFGIGATHNTYADLLVDFGILGVSLITFMLIHIRRQIAIIVKCLFTLPGLVFCIILFYMGTLSMLKYAMLFLFGGVFIGYTNHLLIRK